MGLSSGQFIAADTSLRLISLSLVDRVWKEDGRNLDCSLVERLLRKWVKVIRGSLFSGRWPRTQRANVVHEWSNSGFSKKPDSIYHGNKVSSLDLLRNWVLKRIRFAKKWESLILNHIRSEGLVIRKLNGWKDWLANPIYCPCLRFRSSNSVSRTWYRIPIGEWPYGVWNVWYAYRFTSRSFRYLASTDLSADANSHFIDNASSLLENMIPTMDALTQILKTSGTSNLEFDQGTRVV